MVLLQCVAHSPSPPAVSSTLPRPTRRESSKAHASDSEYEYESEDDDDDEPTSRRERRAAIDELAEDDVLTDPESYSDSEDYGLEDERLSDQQLFYHHRAPSRRLRTDKTFKPEAEESSEDEPDSAEEAESISDDSAMDEDVEAEDTNNGDESAEEAEDDEDEVRLLIPLLPLS